MENDKIKGSIAIFLASVIAVLAIAGTFIYSRGIQKVNKEKTSGEATSAIKKDWPILGDPNAPVTITEYSDFGCPYCALFQKQILPLIKQKYIDTGKVKFIYKDFISVGSYRAAEASHCADEQGKYWEYSNLLFKNQTPDQMNWSDPTIPVGYVKQLGLNTDDFTKCFTSRRYRKMVADATSEGKTLGVTGTPTFFINGQIVEGAQRFSVFQQIIDGFLSNTQSPKN